MGKCRILHAHKSQDILASAALILIFFNFANTKLMFLMFMALLYVM